MLKYAGIVTPWNFSSSQDPKFKWANILESESKNKNWPDSVPRLKIVPKLFQAIEHLKIKLSKVCGFTAL
jgi:hypothetical protein